MTLTTSWVDDGDETHGHIFVNRLQAGTFPRSPALWKKTDSQNGGMALINEHPSKPLHSLPAIFVLMWCNDIWLCKM